MSPQGIRRIRRTIRQHDREIPSFSTPLPTNRALYFARFVAELVNVPCTDTHFHIWADLLVLSMSEPAGNSENTVSLRLRPAQSQRIAALQQVFSTRDAIAAPHGHPLVAPQSHEPT
jgi:hypothetical protein